MFPETSGFTAPGFMTRGHHRRFPNSVPVVCDTIPTHTHTPGHRVHFVCWLE